MRRTSKDMDSENETLMTASAEKIIQWAVAKFGNGLVMSTSFGMQSAVMLHAVSRVKPDIPIIWIDTGYLPIETYTFAHDLIQVRTSTRPPPFLHDATTDLRLASL